MEKVSFQKLANFTPKQKLFLELVKNYRYTLLSGVVGTGKSRCLRWTLLYLLLKYASKGYTGLQAGLFCNTYPELNDRHLKYIKQEFPNWLGTYNEQKHEFRLFEEYGGGILAFRNLDEPMNYRSVEFAFIGVDELTQIPKETFDILIERNRWAGLKDVKFIAASNPVGPYKEWVRRLFIEKQLENSAVLYLYKGDNPYLPENYYEELAKNMDEPLKKALLEGDWYALDDIQDKEGYLPLLTSKQLNDAIIDYQYTFDTAVLGIDPGAGGDNTTIVIRDNSIAKILFNKQLSDTMQILPLIADYYQKYRLYGIVIDITGIGKGIYDRLNEIGLFLKTLGISFGQKAEEPNRFFNKKAELFWKLREWILKGGKLLKDNGWNELLEIKYKHQSDKVIRIQPKEELLKKGIKSPNVADALALTFAIDLEQLQQLKQFEIYEIY